jgi:hypothetical protein
VEWVGGRSRLVVVVLVAQRDLDSLFLDKRFEICSVVSLLFFELTHFLLELSDLLAVTSMELAKIPQLYHARGDDCI